MQRISWILKTVERQNGTSFSFVSYPLVLGKAFAMASPMMLVYQFRLALSSDIQDWYAFSPLRVARSKVSWLKLVELEFLLHCTKYLHTLFSKRQMAMVKQTG